MKSVIFSSLLCLTFGINAAHATDNASPAPSPWTVSGYGTLGFVTNVSNDRVFSREFGTYPGDGGESHWLPDSRIGLQVGYRLSPQTEAVAQIVVRDHADMHWGDYLEWAYVSHQATPDLQLRFGRVGADFFMLSDYRSVDYAQTSIRPDWNFYSWLQMYSLDGVDAVYAFDAGEARIRLKLQAGNSRSRGERFDVKVRNIVSASITGEQGAFRARASYLSVTLGNSIAATVPLIQGLQQVATLSIPGISAEADRYANDIDVNGAKARYASVGVAYDDGLWVGLTEIAHTRLDHLSSSVGNASYAMVGRRVGRVTPYVELSRYRPNGRIATANGDWGAFLGPQGSALQAGAIEVANANRISQTIESLGLRWDFHSQMALKLQWDQIEVDPVGYGLWQPAPALGRKGERNNLVSASLNWVF